MLYADFKKAILKAYPEVQENREGTLEKLEILCAEYRNIQRSEEGWLTRFGVKFHELVNKLSKAPAIILNKEVCKCYLNALERGFAESLRMAINTRNLIKEDLQQAGANPQVGEHHHNNVRYKEEANNRSEITEWEAMKVLIGQKVFFIDFWLRPSKILPLAPASLAEKPQGREAAPRSCSFSTSSVPRAKPKIEPHYKMLSPSVPIHPRTEIHLHTVYT
jgi:hypothetical protein